MCFVGCSTREERINSLANLGEEQLNSLGLVCRLASGGLMLLVVVDWMAREERINSLGNVREEQLNSLVFCD